MSGGADAAALPPGVTAAAVDEIAAGFPAALAEAAAAACRRLRARGVCCEEAHALEMPATVRRMLAGALALARPDEDAALRHHYLAFMPGLRCEQMHASTPLLHEPLVWAQMPSIFAALQRLLLASPSQSVTDPVRGERVEPPRAAWLASSLDELQQQCPTLDALFRRARYGRYLPLLTGDPATLARLAQRVAQGEALPRVIERHLGAALLHELSHGARHGDGEALDFPPYLDECWASYVCTRLLPAATFPGGPGSEDAPRALYGAPWLVQVGQALARFAAPQDPAEIPLRPRLPVELSAALAALAWEEHALHRSLHFLSATYTPEPWLKLLFLGLAGALPPPQGRTLAALQALAFADIPCAPETALDEETLAFALRAVLLRNRLCQAESAFLVEPAPAGAVVAIDLRACAVSCADDGMGRALRYLFPSATAARLRARGVAGFTVEITAPLAGGAGLPDGLLAALWEGAGDRRGAGYALTRHPL